MTGVERKGGNHRGLEICPQKKQGQSSPLTERFGPARDCLGHIVVPRYRRIGFRLVADNSRSIEELAVRHIGPGHDLVHKAPVGTFHIATVTNGQVPR